MAIRDLIPWSRQESRLPVSVSAQRDRADHPLLSLHRDVNRVLDDVFRGFGVRSLGSVERSLAWPDVELGETDKDIGIAAGCPASTRRTSTSRSRTACCRYAARKDPRSTRRIAAIRSAATAASNVG